MVMSNHSRPDSSWTGRGIPTVLCVDDEPLTRKALRRLLRRAPYDLHFAETPDQALDLVRSQAVDLVITDQRMPAMSGVELLREVRRSSPGTPGLILTAYPESVFVDDPPEEPRPPLFAKPWDDQTLLEGIEQILGERRRGKKDATLRTVLVPLDGSIEAELALGSASPLLQGEPARVILLRVLPDLGLHRDVYAYLEKTRRRLSSQGMDAIADVRWGDPAEQILLHARHAHADLIVLPIRRERGLARLFRRSVAERVLRGTDVPVLVSRPELAVRPFRRLIVLLDGSREAEATLPDALRLAAKTGATIDLVGMETGARSENLAPYLADVAGVIGLTEVAAEPTVLIGDLAREVHRHAQDRGADLVLLTDRDRGGWSRLWTASLAARIVRSSPCPVYVRRVAS